MSGLRQVAVFLEENPVKLVGVLGTHRAMDFGCILCVPYFPGRLE